VGLELVVISYMPFSDFLPSSLLLTAKQFNSTHMHVYIMYQELTNNSLYRYTGHMELM
jgi:hypothetical protein